jgi:ABC-type sugar transport system permease subunit
VSEAWLGQRLATGTVIPWLLLSSALVALGAVSFFPVLNGIWLSLTNTSLITNDDSFVGVANYSTLLADSQFWNAWKHTVIFTVVSTGLETAIGMGMALLLFEAFVGRSVVRAAMLVPRAMPTVVTSRMFGWLFDGQHGLVNYILVQLGVFSANVDWYGSAHTAFATIIAADVWKTTPFMALLLLAGLQTISASLVEAARMDVGTPWTIFWYALAAFVADAADRRSVQRAGRHPRVRSRLPTDGR